MYLGGGGARGARGREGAHTSRRECWGCCVIAAGVWEERTASRRDDSGRGHARRRCRRGSRRITWDCQSIW